MRFVVDHLAKPAVMRADDHTWADELSRLASLPNVVCKLSGLVTEADWKTWHAGQLGDYLLSALEWFGTDRVMFGSDWPVCLLAASYEDVLGLVRGVIDEARAARTGGCPRGYSASNLPVGCAPGLTMAWLLLVPAAALRFYVAYRLRHSPSRASAQHRRE